jgi:hypothetical protein
MNSLSQGNKGIRALARGYDMGGDVYIPRFGNIERLLANRPGFDYMRDVLGVTIPDVEGDDIPESDRLAMAYGGEQIGDGRGSLYQTLNYGNVSPGQEISIDARDETPSAYRFYPSEVSKIYSEAKGVPFSPLVSPPKEATYVDDLGSRRIQSQLYAKNGTFVNTGGDAGDVIKDVIHAKYYGMPTAPIRMGINALDRMSGGTGMIGRGISSLASGMRRVDDFTRGLLDVDTYKRKRKAPAVPVAATPAVSGGDAGGTEETEDDAPRRMELPRFTQDRQAIFDENVGRMQEIASRKYMAEGGEAFPERDELVTGPGGERGDKIPAMLSDGEFVFNSAAVRGMGIMAGASPEDEYEQRLMGARQMYNFQKQAEEMAKMYK